MSSPDEMESLRAERDTLRGLLDLAERRGVSTFAIELRPYGIRVTGPSSREEAMVNMAVDLIMLALAVDGDLAREDGT